MHTYVYFKIIKFCLCLTGEYYKTSSYIYVSRSSPNIILVMKPRRMSLSSQLANFGENGNVKKSHV
jgi:hypothetical protein